MLFAKSRFQRRSVVVTLPSDTGKKLSANQEYVVIYSKDSVITLLPKINEPFASGDFGKF